MDRLHIKSKTAWETSVCSISHNPSTLGSFLVNNLTFILFTKNNYKILKNNKEQYSRYYLMC